MKLNNDITHGVCKYKNIMGITCYMNSILHILQQLPYFINYIYDQSFMENIKNENNNLLILEIYKLFKLSLDNDDNTITPNGFRKFVSIKDDRWAENIQQDSQEFLIFIISTLKEELGLNYDIIYGNHNFILNNDIIKKNNKKSIIYNLLNINIIYQLNMYKLKEHSLLSSLFDHIIKKSRQCTFCNSNSYKLEDNIELSLIIPSNKQKLTLYDCIDSYLSSTDNDDISYCNFCGLNIKKKVKQLFWKLPEILIFMFKRFYNIEKKIYTNIKYPIKNLNLEKYFDGKSPYKNIKYNLVGINIHKGHLYNGHYISIIKNMFNKKWCLYNDEYPVIEIDDLKNLQDNDTYILFYKSINL